MGRKQFIGEQTARLSHGNRERRFGRKTGEFSVAVSRMLVLELVRTVLVNQNQIHFAHQLTVRAEKRINDFPDKQKPKLWSFLRNAEFRFLFTWYEFFMFIQ